MPRNTQWFLIIALNSIKLNFISAPWKGCAVYPCISFWIDELACPCRNRNKSKKAHIKNFFLENEFKKKKKPKQVKSNEIITLWKHLKRDSPHLLIQVQTFHALAAIVNANGFCNQTGKRENILVEKYFLRSSFCRWRAEPPPGKTAGRSRRQPWWPFLPPTSSWLHLQLQTQGTSTGGLCSCSIVPNPVPLPPVV